jgi:hypothetical protein
MLLQDLTSLQASKIEIDVDFFFFCTSRVFAAWFPLAFRRARHFFEYDTNGLFDKQARDSQSKETKERIYDVNHYSSEYC